MEEDVHSGFNSVCSTCLSSDRLMYSLNECDPVFQVFRLLMHDFEADRFGKLTPEIENIICWECLAMMKKFSRFKIQVQSAQEHLHFLAMSRTQESLDHTYMSQSLSSLVAVTKNDYDNIYMYLTQDEWPQPYLVSSEDVKNEHFDIAQTVRDNIQLNIDDHILEVPEMVLENPVTGVMSRIVVGTDALVSPADTINKRDQMSISMIEQPKAVKKIKITPLQANYVDCISDTELLRTIEVPQLEVTQKKPQVNNSKSLGYITDYMTEGDLMALRTELKNKVQYVSASYKCELCIIGFYTQQQVEDHFLSDHRAKPGRSACQICYTYVDDLKLSEHTDMHYLRHTCKMCGHREYSVKMISLHVNTHLKLDNSVTNAVIRIGAGTGKRKKKTTNSNKPPP
ncbi:unnamed protein product, partial [Diatraea saccharalis]